MIGAVVERTVAFTLEHEGFTIKAFYRGDDQSADIEIRRDGKEFNFYKYPAYRIWNLYHHFQQMVDDHLAWEKQRAEGGPQ